MRRVGQTTSDDAATAAGDAAYTRAQQSSWPPTEGDYEAVGAVAGAAAGTVIGGPLGAAIGSAVGTAVGSAVFTLGEAISGGLDPNRGAGDAPTYWRYVNHEVSFAPIETARLLAERCNTSESSEITALQNRGVEIDNKGSIADQVTTSWRTAMGAGGPAGVARTRPKVNDFLKRLFAASSARIAECETLKQTEGSSKNSPGAVITLGVISFLGVGILQKFITRGKF
jgi:hypothetical protein